ncbi:YheC/YheD family protein [Ammoniphilus sp. YIM 78166]|uniref:YheC/YheD family endospore coat-associated protein n=1 Tax=Ammoniphilus sp. YIM 78166 TaxID=1644106 RepID=UPI0010702EFB|nr:YheC/YheD family protein [Ammoniphilus sp. YIM 78166]
MSEKGLKMAQVYRIISYETHPPILMLHSLTRRKLRLIGDHWTLRFGIQTMKITLQNCDFLSSHELIVSQSLIKRLRIPLELSYELIRSKDELILGPFIGILGARSNKGLLISLNHVKHYCRKYSSLNGLIIAFSLEGVNRKEQTITGYKYNPYANQWEPGLFSYPSSIFKITDANKDWVDYFESVIGNRIFNSQGIDKWDMYLLLNKNPVIKPHLAETVLYQDINDLRSFLTRYENVFIKPLNSYGGHGILRVAKLKGQLTLSKTYRQHHRKSFDNTDHLLKKIKKKINKAKYIIQKGIDLFSYNGSPIDFRIIMVKNQRGKWSETGFVARFGEADSIVTNISAGGIAESGDAALRSKMNLTKKEAASVKQRMFSLAFEACRCIDGYGNYGNLGIDMAIDKEGHLWIIEVNNNNPDPTIALDMGNKKLFKKIVLTNMLYAKRLAGFSEMN